MPGFHAARSRISAKTFTSRSTFSAAPLWPLRINLRKWWLVESVRFHHAVFGCSGERKASGALARCYPKLVVHPCCPLDSWSTDVWNQQSEAVNYRTQKSSLNPGTQATTRLTITVKGSNGLLGPLRMRQKLAIFGVPGVMLHCRSYQPKCTWRIINVRLKLCFFV